MSDPPRDGSQPRDTAPSPLPGQLRKPLPEDPVLLRDLYDETTRIVAEAEDWLRAHAWLAGLLRGVWPEEMIWEGVHELGRLPVPRPCLLCAFAPWTKEQLKFFRSGTGADQEVPAGADHEVPAGVEIGADGIEGAWMRWVLDQASTVRQAAFDKLAEKAPERSPVSSPTSSDPVEEAIEKIGPSSDGARLLRELAGRPGRKASLKEIAIAMDKTGKNPTRSHIERVRQRYKRTRVALDEVDASVRLLLEKSVVELVLRDEESLAR